MYEDDDEVFNTCICGHLIHPDYNHNKCKKCDPDYYRIEDKRRSSMTQEERAFEELWNSEISIYGGIDDIPGFK